MIRFGDLFRYSLQKQYKYFLIGSIVIISLTTAYYLYYTKVSNNIPNGQECSSQSRIYILKQASEYLNPNDTQKLQTVVTKIQAISSYEKDPNCLYVLVNYYIYVGDYKNASLYLNELKKVYNVSHGFSSYLRINIQSIQNMEFEISAIQQNSIDEQKNAIEFGTQP